MGWEEWLLALLAGWFGGQALVLQACSMPCQLALTSGSLGSDSVDSRLLRILAVATLATVVERETQAELNTFLGAFVDVCCRQVVLVIIGGCDAAEHSTKSAATGARESANTATASMAGMPQTRQVADSPAGSLLRWQACLRSTPT